MHLQRHGVGLQAAGSQHHQAGVSRLAWVASATGSRTRRVCKAWDSEEAAAARWQELPEQLSSWSREQQPHLSPQPPQQQQELGPSSAADQQQGPSATVARLLDVVRTGNLDGMLEFCSDEVIDKLLALKQTPGCVCNGSRNEAS